MTKNTDHDEPLFGEGVKQLGEALREARMFVDLAERHLSRMVREHPRAFGVRTGTQLSGEVQHRRVLLRNALSRLGR